MSKSSAYYYDLIDTDKCRADSDANMIKKPAEKLLIMLLLISCLATLARQIKRRGVGRILIRPVCSPAEDAGGEKSCNGFGVWHFI